MPVHVKSKNSKAVTVYSSEDSSDSDESIHVMDHKEANDARMRHARNRLRERFAQLQKKCHVALTTTATDEAMDEGIDEALEEEKAFHEQVNRADDGQTANNHQTANNDQTLVEGQTIEEVVPMTDDGQTADEGQTTKKTATRKN